MICGIHVHITDKLSGFLVELIQSALCTDPESACLVLQDIIYPVIAYSGIIYLRRLYNE